MITNRREAFALTVNAVSHAAADAQRMRTAGFAEAADQGFVVGFEEQKARGNRLTDALE